MNEIRGGCETFFSNLQDMINEAGHEAKLVSFNQAKTVLGIGLEKSSMGFFEAEASHIIDRYCKLYLELFPETKIISNAGITNFWYKHPQTLQVFNDPYKATMDKLLRLGWYGAPAYNKFSNILVLMQKGSAQGATNIAVSDFMANEMEKSGIIADKVIPHGIDLGMFRSMENKEELREKYGIPKDAVVAIWSKGFEPVAGFHIISYLVKKYKDIFWVLNFKHGGDYKTKAKNVRIIKAVEHEKMPEIYNLSDFCINPSVAESFGLVPLEAMACGLPCILTNTGFVWERDMKEEMSEREYGILVNHWKEKSFEKAVEALLKSKEEFRPYEVAKKYDKERWKTEWRKVIG